MSDDYIDDVFGPVGLLARRFAGYSPRQGQIDFARAVHRAISEGEHLIAECPTGTGKSIGYAVPATYAAAHEKLRVVIVTANIALQEQLVRKDLPLLAELLPWKFTYALLKGRNNYLCLDRLENGVAEPFFQDDLKKAEQIVDWSKGTTTGDKSELVFEPEHRLWNRFAVTSDECLGSDCEFQDQCWANAAQVTAAEAAVVVTNYHLLFADMQVREMTEDMAFILPRYDIAILDEGHKAADIARDFFGGEITANACKRAVGLLPSENRDGMDAVIDDFFEQLRAFRRSPGYKARLRQPNSVMWKGDSGIADTLREAINWYDYECKQIQEQIDLDDLDREQRRTKRKRLRKLAKRAQRAIEIDALIVEAMTLPPPARPQDLRVHFIEEDNDKVKLCSKAVSVAERLREDLIEQTLSVVVTSATLAVRGSFDFVISDLGAESAKTLIAESPFNFREQALLVIPSGLPDPTKQRQQHAALVTETIARVIEEADGRTLGLFTSRRGVDEAYRRAIKTGYRILRQGEMPRTKLIDEFRRDVKSVLLGTESFWAGVDVPGESLSCVFIDRLPFAPPDDPILNALEGQYKDCFMRFSVPRAIIAFKQGFGRLIRSATDRGVVVCMDGRLTTKGYGHHFLQSLPAVQRSRDIADVGRFLRGEPLQNAVTLLPSTASAASLVDW